MKTQLLLLITSLFLFAQDIPHPGALSYAPFDWKIPLGEPYRTELIGSIPAYIVQDSSLPLFSLRIVFERGTLHEPSETPGLATLHAMTLKNGGSKKLAPSELEEFLELYALSLSVQVDKSTTTVTISGLSDYLDTAITVVGDLLKKPRFDEDRFLKNQANIQQQLEHQFDTPSPILSTAWRKTLYPGTQRAVMLTPEDLVNIDAKLLKKYHRELLSWAPISIAAAGDISANDVERFAQEVVNKKKKNLIPYQTIVSQPKFSTVIVHKEGVNQAYIATGFPGLTRPDNRYYPLALYNQILGGGGFNTRLVSQIRNDAGLTYSIYSSVESNYLFQGTFNTTLFTKSESVNHAIALTHKVIQETAKEELSPQEIEEKRVQLIESLPSYFRTANDIAFTYQQNELDGRTPTHFVDYPQRLKAITTDSLKQVVQEFFSTPLVTVVVGDTIELYQAPTWEGYSLKEAVDTVLSVEELTNFGIIANKKEKKE